MEKLYKQALYDILHASYVEDCYHIASRALQKGHEASEHYRQHKESRILLDRYDEDWYDRL